MREVIEKVYKFDELSQTAKKNAYKSWYENECFDDICDRTNRELKDLFDDFCSQFDIKFNYWNIDSEQYSYRLKHCPEVMSKQNVYKYLAERYEKNKILCSLQYSDIDFLSTIRKIVTHIIPTPDYLISAIISNIEIVFDKWKDILKYYKSEEFFLQEMESNEIEFFEDGKIYQGGI